MDRAFRGVWIPANIYLDERLTPTEIYLLAEVESLDTGDGCLADNKYLATFCKCDIRSISRFLTHLRTIGLVDIETLGNKRKIRRIPSEAKTVETMQRFTPPTIEEVRAYCEERRNGIDAERFVDFYAARGWMVAKGMKMVDWRACLRSWERSTDYGKDKKKDVGMMEHNYTEEKLKGALVDFDKWEEENDKT